MENAAQPNPGATPPPQQNTPKDQLSALDKDLKAALKKADLATAQQVLEKMKGIAPQDGVVIKAEKSLNDFTSKQAKNADKDQKKARAERIKEYDRVFRVLFSSGEVEKIYQLAQELKAFDPGGKLADKWIARAKKFEAAIQQGEHAGEISELQAKIKTAFAEKKFDDAMQLIDQLSKFDPINHFGKKYIKKIERERRRSDDGSASVGQVQRIKESAMDTMMDLKNRAMSMFDKPHKSSIAMEDEQDEKDLTVVPSLGDSADGSSGAQAQSAQGAGDNIFEGIISPELQQRHQDEQGNIFTRMFAGSEGAGKAPQSIIDAIVDKKAEEKEKGKAAGKTKVVEKRQEGFLVLGFSKAFLNFSIVFVIFSATFLYVNIIDKNNVALQLFNIEENYAQKLHGSAIKLDELKDQKKEIDQEVRRYQEGYNNTHEAVVKRIINSRLNWPDVLAKINEVANSIYELNDFFQYIQFNNFSFDAGSGKISLSGSLRDPGKRNLTRMVELEEAFRYYPGDKDLANENIKPYFLNTQEFTSYSKSFDGNTGDYISRFSMSMNLNK